jgi:hypothetical protein
MAKNTFNLNGKVLEYNDDTITCMSEKFKNLPSLDWNALSKNARHYSLDGSGGAKVSEKVLDEIQRDLKTYGFGEKDRNEFFLTVTEAIDNAQKHTLRYNEGKKANITAYYAPGVALIGV